MNSRILITFIIITTGYIQLVSQSINTDTLTVTFYNESRNFNFSDINDVHMGSDSYIWLGLWKQSLLRINEDDHKYYMKDEGGRSTFTVSSIYEDSNNQIWVGDEPGFQKFNKVNGQFTSCALTSLKDKGSYERQIVAMHEVNDSLMLLGSLAGIHLYDKYNDTIVKFHLDGAYALDGASTTNNIKKFCLGTDTNTMWYTSRSGLGKVDLTDFSATHIDSKYDEELGHVWLMKDIVNVDDKLYIKYKHTNILSYNPKHNKWKLVFSKKLKNYLGKMTQKDSLPVYLNNFQKIDERYFLTSSREYGAMIFDSSTDKFLTTYIADKEFAEIGGFESTALEHHRYFTNAYWALLDKNGYLWASFGREKIIRTNQPLVKTGNPISYGKVHLENIYINGRPTTDHTLIDNMSFSTDQRNLGFAYSLANVSDTKELSYRYRLHKSDSWEKPLDKLARFTNLSGGNHTLYLEALVEGNVVADRVIKIAIKKKWFEEWYNLLLTFLLAAFPILLFIRYYINKNNETSSLKTKMAELEMAALRAQMNPHFLFNSLNSINQYIMTESPQKASAYLTKFSMLMRNILKNSKSKLVPLQDEISALNLYVEMEQLRFQDSFSFTIAIENNIDQRSTLIPPLIIQPYIENAIMHGLALLEGRQGVIKLTINSQDDHLNIYIVDNGIGRKAAREIQAGKRIKKESYGMSITNSRIELATPIHSMNGKVTIADNRKNTGTTVHITLPLITPTTQKHG